METPQQLSTDFQATNENYERAVKQLEERFGDRQVMVSGHMNKFKEIKSVQDITDINGLRELFDKLETNVRSKILTKYCNKILESKLYHHGIPSFYRYFSFFQTSKNIFTFHTVAPREFPKVP